MTVVLPVRVGLPEIDDLLARSFMATTRAVSVEFDLRGTDWIGHFSSALLFAWIKSLVGAYKKKVEVLLPEALLMTAQSKKALLRSQVVENMRSSGATIDGVIPSQQMQ